MTTQARPHPALDRINAARVARGLDPVSTHNYTYDPANSPAPVVHPVVHAGAGTGTTTGTTGTTAAAATGQNALAPTSAFNQFANSAGLKFAQQQSANAINNLYAAHGALQSGAAMKAISDRAQQIGIQDYFMPYMSMLQGQQNMGASSAAALAGAGSSFGQTAQNITSNLGSAAGQTAANASNAIGNNTANASGAMQSGANALSNSQIANGAANAGVGSAIGSAAGQIAGAVYNPYGSSYSSPSSYGGPIVTGGSQYARPLMY